MRSEEGSFYTTGGFPRLWGSDRLYGERSLGDGDVQGFNDGLGRLSTAQLWPMKQNARFIVKRCDERYEFNLAGMSFRIHSTSLRVNSVRNLLLRRIVKSRFLASAKQAPALSERRFLGVREYICLFCISMYRIDSEESSV